MPSSAVQCNLARFVGVDGYRSAIRGGGRESSAIELSFAIVLSSARWIDEMLSSAMVLSSSVASGEVSSESSSARIRSTCFTSNGSNAAGKRGASIARGKGSAAILAKNAADLLLRPE